MATVGACIFLAVSSPVFRRQIMSSSEKPKRNPILKRVAVSTERTSAATTTVMTETTPTRIFVEKKSSELVEDEAETKQRVNVREYSEEESEGNGKSLKDYFDEAEDMIKSSSGGGPPRWFSPLECGSHTRDSPLLLFLPGAFLFLANPLLLFMSSPFTFFNAYALSKNHLLIINILFIIFYEQKFSFLFLTFCFSLPFSFFY